MLLPTTACSCMHRCKPTYFSPSLLPFLSPCMWKRRLPLLGEVCKNGSASPFAWTPIEIFSGTEIKAGSSRRISPQKTSWVIWQHPPSHDMQPWLRWGPTEQEWFHVELPPPVCCSFCLSGWEQQRPAGLQQVPLGFKIALCNYCQLFFTWQ